MNSSQLRKAKREVRRRVLALRDRIPPAERERLARLVTDRFLVLPEVGTAATVMVSKGKPIFTTRPTPPLEYCTAAPPLPVPL